MLARKPDARLGQETSGGAPYLSQALLRMRGWTRDLADANRMHKTVMTLFPNDIGESPRSTLDVLFRVEPPRESEDGPVVPVLIQSAVTPNWEAWDAGQLRNTVDARTTSLSPIFDAISVGTVWNFRLRASPTKRIMVPVMGQRGQRVDLRTETEQIAWLERKLRDEAGSVLLDFGFADEGMVVAGAGKRAIRHRAVLFDGVLGVEEPSLLRTAIRQGVGRGRSYGMGMLSLAPRRS